ncbi:unnamed protein product [Vicia faba]|uniref:Leucine-rich repeat-containing N-terminal plant-type domain-containing protein n=1 Tax=Vicia faba TaxID=3906 RepID=A0AAV1ADB0_VICFA|nr:unnamed protein product [Vicia faba]
MPRKMRKVFYILFLSSLSVYCFMVCLAMNTKNITTDEFSLLQFKSLITLDPYDILANNWSTSSSSCSWVGVTCDKKHNRVQTLNLKNMGLRGTLSPNIGNLSFLVILDLSGNSFGGQFPKETLSLRRLRVLDFSYNEFVGEIPKELGKLQELQHLYIGINSFTGSIPSMIGQLRRLQVLDTSYNKFSGPIPQQILNLSSLQQIYLSSNFFSGNISL